MIKQLPYPIRAQLRHSKCYSHLMGTLKDKGGNLVWDISTNINSNTRLFTYRKDGLKPLLGYNVTIPREKKKLYAYGVLADIVYEMYAPIMHDVVLLRDPVNKVFLTKTGTNKYTPEGYNYILVQGGKYKGRSYPSFTRRNMNVEPSMVLKTLRLFDVCEATQEEREALADIYLATFMKFAYRVTKIRMRLRWGHHLYELGRVITWANWFLAGRDISFLTAKGYWERYINKSDHFNYLKEYEDINIKL